MNSSLLSLIIQDRQRELERLTRQRQLVRQARQPTRGVRRPLSRSIGLTLMRAGRRLAGPDVLSDPELRRLGVPAGRPASFGPAP